jgi:hypothetical protein
MQQHPADCLRGPVSRGRRQWPSTARPADAPIRHDLVERVRREIAAGTYDTDEKLEIALLRLFEGLE